MAGLKSVVQTTLLRVKNDRRTQLRYGAFVLLFLSLIFSFGGSPILFFGWIALGVMGVLLLYKLLERYFFIVLWLGGIYLLVCLGCLIMFHFSVVTGNWFLTVLGLSMLMGAFMGGLLLIYFTKERRDRIALEGPRVNIGLFSAGIVAFEVFSFWSMIGFIRWADGDQYYPWIFRTIYLLSETIVILMLIYITGFMEDRLVIPSMTKVTDEGFLKNLLNNITGARAVFRSVPEMEKKELICPICTKPLKRQIRNCPSCDSPRYFYWCIRSEEYFIRCPNCMKLTPVGRARCIECSMRMSNSIRCSKCKTVNSVKDWVLLS